MTTKTVSKWIEEGFLPIEILPMLPNYGILSGEDVFIYNTSWDEGTNPNTPHPWDAPSYELAQEWGLFETREGDVILLAQTEEEVEAFLHDWEEDQPPVITRDWVQRESKSALVWERTVFRKEFRDFSRGRDEMSDLRTKEVYVRTEYVIPYLTTKIIETRWPNGAGDHRIAGEVGEKIESPIFASYEEASDWLKANHPDYEAIEQVFPTGTGPIKRYV